MAQYGATRAAPDPLDWSGLGAPTHCRRLLAQPPARFRADQLRKIVSALQEFSLKILAINCLQGETGFARAQAFESEHAPKGKLLYGPLPDASIVRQFFM